MKQKIKYKKNPHQAEFAKDITTKFLHLSSGFGAGKSHGLIMKALHLSVMNKPHSGGFICPSYTDYKKDILPLMEGILENNRVKYSNNKSDFWFQFPWSRGKLYIATAEKKLRGPNWAFACINEVSLISHESYKEVIGRVRVKNAKCSQIASVGTPEGTAHWLYDVFIENPMKKSRVIYGDTRDNLDNLDSDYIESLENSYDSKMLDAYLKGLWVNMNNNRFYYSYTTENEDKSIVRHEYATVHASLDFNVDKMCCTLWNYDGKHLSGFDSIILRNNADTKKMCIALKARGYMPDMITIYPDPSGNARSTKGKPDIQIMRDHGFHDIKVKSSQPRMRTRQLNVNNLLEKGIIKIHPVKCKDLKKDLEGVEQDPVNLEKIKKNRELTHSSDGLDYMCDILFPFSGHRRESSVVKYR